jgi:hypothetical protein
LNTWVFMCSIAFPENIHAANKRATVNGPVY